MLQRNERRVKALPFYKKIIKMGHEQDKVTIFCIIFAVSLQNQQIYDMKKLLLSIAFLLPGMGMMAQTQVTTAEGILEGKDLSGITVSQGYSVRCPSGRKSPLEGSAACTEMAGRSRGQGVRTRTRCRNLSSAI